MKQVLGIVAAAVTLSAVAVAQTPSVTPGAPPSPPPAAAVPAPVIPPSTCGEIPPEPTLPAPGSVANTRAANDITLKTVNPWIEAARPVLACRQNEANNLARELREKQAIWEARRAEFSAAQGKVTDVGNRWQAEVASAAAKSGGSDGERKGGTGRTGR